jgi:hypothetical protein
MPRPKAARAPEEPNDTFLTTKVPRFIKAQLIDAGRKHDRTLSAEVRAVLRAWAAREYPNATPRPGKWDAVYRQRAGS